MYNNEPRPISIANNYTKTISPTGSGRQSWQRNANTFANYGKQDIRVKKLRFCTLAQTNPVNKRQIRMNQIIFR